MQITENEEASLLARSSIGEKGDLGLNSSQALAGGQNAATNTNMSLIH